MNAKIEELVKKASQEVSGMTAPESIDRDNLDAQDLAQTATLLRLKRIVDKNFNNLLEEHCLRIQNMRSADTAASAYTEDYLLELPISYDALRTLCDTMCILVRRYGVEPPQHWIDMAQGDFNYDKELDLSELS